MFINNAAKDNSDENPWSLGGAIHAWYVSFKGNSTVVFSNNSADDGGAIYCEPGGCISFEENSSSVFSDNTVYLWSYKWLYIL